MWRFGYCALPFFLRFASLSLLPYCAVSKEYDIINGARESYDTRLLSSAVVKFIRSTIPCGSCGWLVAEGEEDWGEKS